MMALFALVTMKGGLRQVVVLHVECYYHKGTQSLVIPATDDEKIHSLGKFDGVNNDRFIYYLYHEASGDECAEYHYHKQ